jgi:copper transport protein
VTRARRLAAVIAIAAAMACGFDQRAGAHSGLRFSSPLDGATLGDAPTSVQLTFVEAPEPSLSTIRVVDTGGNAYHAERPEPVAGDPLSLAVALRPLAKGVYIVHWRAVSAVDGHASAGAFAFGVLVDPSGAAVGLDAGTPTSPLEVTGRPVLLTGLMLLIGATAAGLAHFGSHRAVAVAAVGWLLSIAGLVLLALAQVQVAGVGVAELAGTAIGRALIWRLIALVVAGMLIAVAAYGRRIDHSATERIGIIGAALATLAAIAVHSAAGHAAAGRWPPIPTIAIQVVHIAVAGVWLGGLVALIAGLKSAPSELTTASVRRFSTIAFVGLIVVTVSGVARSVQEVSRWSDLLATSYGGLIVAKAALLIGIAVLGALNRWRSVPKVAIDLGPLRRIGRAEAGLAVVAVIAAGFLGALPPSAASRLLAGIDASGADFGTTVRARLTAASDGPGPNRFTVEVHDYDSDEPVRADRVSLRFTPLDDPGVTATSLPLTRSDDGSYAGAGPNLSFAGRWRVGVMIERGGNSVEVPLDVATREPAPFVSVLRAPGRQTAYTVTIAQIAQIRFEPASDSPGKTELLVTCFNHIGEVMPIEHFVVTAGEGQSVRQLPFTRRNRHQFVTSVQLQPGANRFVAVARTETGTRLRAAVNIEAARN